MTMQERKELIDYKVKAESEARSNNVKGWIFAFSLAISITIIVSEFIKWLFP